MLKIIHGQKLPRLQYDLHPKFGTVFTPHVLHIPIELGQRDSWEATIKPFVPEKISVTNLTFHYGQSVFEGMKAFAQSNGTVAIFRPDLHAKRFRLSCERLAMPPMPEEIFSEALKAFVSWEKDCVPKEEDHSLYLRPLMIARDEKVKVQVSQSYSFYIMSCIVGSYFSGGGARPAKVFVNRRFVRACPGGLGEAKTAANYAASLFPQSYAEKLGCDQVLYLDAFNHDSIDELGGMNVFFIRGKQLLTPELNGCILNGVTRRSILELASKWGYKPVEAKLSFSQTAEEILSGEIQEAFACGTAAVIQPIGEFLLEEDSLPPKSIQIKSDFSQSLRLRQSLVDIQRGATAGPSGWMLSL